MGLENLLKRRLDVAQENGDLVSVDNHHDSSKFSLGRIVTCSEGLLGLMMVDEAGAPDGYKFYLAGRHGQVRIGGKYANSILMLEAQLSSLPDLPESFESIVSLLEFLSSARIAVAVRDSQDIDTFGFLGEYDHEYLELYVMETTAVSGGSAILSIEDVDSISFGGREHKRVENWIMSGAWRSST